MSSILNTTELIRSIKRRAFIPKDQRTFQDEDFLEMATEEINIGLMDQLIIARGDYLVYHIDLPLDPSVKEYAIPARAHGNKLRDVVIVDSNFKVVQELSQISLDEQFDEDGYYNYNTIAYNTFFIENNMVVLNQDNIEANYYLRMYFYMRPNKLVPVARGATVQSFSTTYEVDNISPLSGLITNISATNPIVITSANHGLVSNDKIQITGSDSTPSVDGNYTVTYIDENNFSVESFDVEPVVTLLGTTGNWAKLVEVYSIQLDVVPKHFSTSIQYDVTEGISPNKIKYYNIYANSLNLVTKVITFPKSSVLELSTGDYFTLMQESIVPNVPTEYHPIIAQRVAVACLEAMGDEQHKTSAERKLAQMEKAVLRIVTNRVEGAPKKIKNRHGTLRQTRNIRRWSY